MKEMMIFICFNSIFLKCQFADVFIHWATWTCTYKCYIIKSLYTKCIYKFTVLKQEAMMCFICSTAWPSYTCYCNLSFNWYLMVVNKEAGNTSCSSFFDWEYIRHGCSSGNSFPSMILWLFHLGWEWNYSFSSAVVYLYLRSFLSVSHTIIRDAILI